MGQSKAKLIWVDHDMGYHYPTIRIITAGRKFNFKISFRKIF